MADVFGGFGFEGRTVVCRECLVDGPVGASDTLAAFFDRRASFIAETFGESPEIYRSRVAGELLRLTETGAGDEVNLWFENELFCQVNYWFCLFLLRDSGARVFRVSPVAEDWEGFARIDAESAALAFSRRAELDRASVGFGAGLWEYFSAGDLESLTRAARSAPESGFPRIEEVCRAAREIGYRPAETLRAIVAGGETDFGKIFERFRAAEGVYGFGDAQVRRLLETV